MPIPSPDDARDDKDAGLSVLVADDIAANRELLKAILRRHGHLIHTVDNGAQAVAAYEKYRPDIVLLDLMMPVMDGYEAARLIKDRANGRFTPIIFLTAQSDEAVLARCIEMGGDDFIVKPISATILKSKITSLMRMRDSHRELERQKKELQRHHDRLRYEHEITEQVFAKIIGNQALPADNIKCDLAPMAVANGDIVLAAATPAGNQLVLLGDFTGHGLSAAIGAIPVSEVFYAMAAKGLGVRDIVAEINRKLCHYLPAGQFLAACLLEWDNRAGVIRAWNGGIPDVLIVGEKGGVVKKLASRNLPMGIAQDEAFEISVDTLAVQNGDRIYLCSDGLIESRNAQGAMFGQDRLERLIADNGDRGRLFEEIRQGAAAFRGDQPQGDDITIVEVLCDAERLERILEINKADKRAADWKMSLRLGPDELLDFDPLGVATVLLDGVSSLKHHRSFIYMIIVELYTNALEHGALGLDGSLKKSPDGFARHYAERKRRLARAAKAWVHLDIECFADRRGGELIIQIEDSGSGFDSMSVIAEENNAGTRGRGIKLVRSLCKSLSYNESGNYVKAVYAWQGAPRADTDAQDEAAERLQAYGSRR
jgi:CheY-like chemotaxis protein/anti-sigma regulatory factor (Ser/Thr protein kinase)